MSNKIKRKNEKNANKKPFPKGEGFKVEEREQNKMNKHKKSAYKSIINSLRLPHSTDFFKEQSLSGKTGGDAV